MIPRLKPYLGFEELTALFQWVPDAVNRFEVEFAREFGSEHAISFPYGRSALWVLLQALGIKDAEIIMPAYTCSVVAHAVVLSHNIPRFVDISLFDYNMDLDQVNEAINSKTRVIIATHLFGYPLNIERLQEIIKNAQTKFGHKIWVIQDCAHSFNAEFNGKPVSCEPDAALFGLNISKQITSIFGGMITTQNGELAGKIRSWQDEHFHNAGVLKTLRRFAYLIAVYLAFWEPLYGLVYALQYRTSLLNHLTHAYHLDEKVQFPPGYDEFMLPIEAKVGLAQVKKYQEIIQHRRVTAAYYQANISALEGWVMPPLMDGATYSHFVIRVPDRKKVLQATAQQGLQLGELIEYSIPEYAGYRQYTVGQKFPNSVLCSRSTINLPIYPSLSEKKKEQVVRIITKLR